MTTQTRTTSTTKTLLICLALLIVTEAQASGKWQSGGEEASKEQAGGEKVDRLTSATGDLIWPGQLEWLLLQQAPPGSNNGRLRVQQAPSDNTDNLYLDANLPLSTSTTVGLDGPVAANMRTYHDDLVDEFKQYARGLVNPSRESRAFKPKLMSTARGFGKRAFPSRITYGDLLEAANPNGAIQSHGKMSEAALSSKYADWISQTLARWPSMSKYLNDKYLDYNGDGIISMDEKYQSL